MIITCEECSVKFNLNEAVLKPEGSKVRCSKCKHVFKAYPPAPLAESTATEKPMEAEAELSDGLTFSDLERMLESKEPEPATSKSKAAEFKLEESEMEIDAKEEELDLSGLDDMLSSKKEEAERQEAPDDLELDLDLEPDEALDDISLEVDTETGDVDFSELDGILESDLAADDKSKAVEPDDLDLSLELEPDKTQEESPVEIDELELDLDLEQKEEADESASGELELELDLELDLDKEEKIEDEEKGELELDLDLDLDKEEEAAPPEAELELELDIDDEISGLAMEGALDKSQETIEKELLETKSLVDADKESDELELELDIDESVEEKAAETEASDEEIDLSELEQTLEMELLAPQDGGDEEPENVELELAEDQEDLSVEVETGSDEEIDVSDIEEMLDMDGVEGEKTGADDLELEFDIDSKSGGEDKEAESQKGKAEASFEETIEEDATPVGREQDFASPEEKKRGKSVLAIAVLLIVLGLGIGGFILLSALGVIPAGKMNIPFISSLFKSSEKKDLGKIEVVQTSINHAWAKGIKDQKLFVITGQVKNTSTKTHRAIQVKADLYSKGKVVTKTIMVYSGNSISNEDLQKLTQEEIDKRLTNQLTPENQPMKLAPGGEQPFMIVIPNLSDDMEEYKVLVAGSIME